MDAWHIIKGLEDEEVACQNAAGGKATWKVISECDEDVFASIRVLSLSQHGKHTGAHAKALLKAGQQVRCVWCSRVNLKETKTTMKFLECNR